MESSINPSPLLFYVPNLCFIRGPMATLFEMIMCVRFHVADIYVAESIQEEIWDAGGYAGLLYNGCYFSGGAIIEVSHHWYDFTESLLIKSKVKYI